tara:strand:- start:6072 stop:7211 length:1140 start_codon:yes stop_codon:yes gene_type:complete
MNLLERYSLSTGFKINKLVPDEDFYPVPSKYITIQTSSGMESKNYDYYLDVLDTIAPKLKEMGYEILHIGRDCKQYPHCVNLINQLNINQTFYVLRNSKLHLGNDSFAVHLAGLHDVPTVALYGPTTAINHGPHFRKHAKLIESHRNGKNPSFSAQESPKTINYIKPEEVINAVFEKLGIEQIESETIYIGSSYGHQVIEIVPNVAVNPQSIKGKVPVIRCDYELNEEMLCKNLSLFQATIITDKETSLDLYQKFKSNIQEINFKVDMNSDLEYIKRLRKIGIPTKLWSDDKENIKDIRFRALDIDNVYMYKFEDVDIEIPEGAKYKSYKYLLSDGKIYMSKEDWKNNRPLEDPNQNVLEIAEKSLDFFKEIQHFRIIS